MKIYSNLAVILRITFSLLRIAVIISSIVMIIAWSFGRMPLITNPLILEPAKAEIQLRSNNSESVIEVKELVARMQFRDASNDTDLAAALRMTQIPLHFSMLVSAYVFLTILRNLCARIAVGNIFTEINIRSIQAVGLLTIASALALCAVEFWSAYVLKHHLVNYELTGVTADVTKLFISYKKTIISLIGSICEGVLILVIAQAARQGLALKREAELTV